MLRQDWCKKFCQLVVGFHLQVLMVEPFALFIVELSARFRHAVQTELCNQFVHGEYLLIAGSMPAKQGKEVDYCLWEIAAFTVSGRNSSVFFVVELQWENRETETIAVTLTQFAVSVGLEKQRQMGKFRHGILPAKSAIK